MSSKQKIYDDEKLIYAEVILKSKSGFSVMKDKATQETVEDFKAEPTVIEKVQKILKNMGFNVIASSPFSISIIGSKETFRNAFGTDIMYSYLKKQGKKTEQDIQFDIPDEKVTIPDALKDMIETVYVPRVVRFHNSVPNPPYDHLEPPQQVSSILNADDPHSKGYLGQGVMVAMVDSGLNYSHWYYSSHTVPINGNHVHPNVDDDFIGHGTAMAANLLAIAPKCDFHFYGMSPNETANIPALVAFNNAVMDGAKVISNSWGCAYDPLIELSVFNAVKQGVTVVFSVGDKGNPDDAAFPSCMHEVISVGGVTPDKKDPTNPNKLRASSFAQSGYNSHPNYQTRRCPDVCGICGEKPHGILIVMPTKKGSFMDKNLNNSGKPHPKGDQTGSNDGWCVGSGTSAAAAQVAGGAALLLQAKSLSPSDVKQILKDTATDITIGSSATNKRAGVGPDDATGHGLINLEAALNKVLAGP